MAELDITTPKEITVTEVHEVSDDGLSQPDRASNTNRTKHSKPLS